MGIIKAVKQAIGGGFADTWQEVIEPDNIGDGQSMPGCAGKQGAE